MMIRTETISDQSSVYQLNYTAFGNREDESKLVERSRSSDGFIPELSIVAEVEGEIAGHVLFSKASVIDNNVHHEVIVLGPIAVSPDRQKQGIGAQLIREGFKRCKELGYGLVLLIGHPSYYLKFGFKPARPFGIELKQFEVPDEVFMVCELKEGVLNKTKGELRYPQAFLEN